MGICLLKPGPFFYASLILCWITPADGADYYTDLSQIGLPSQEDKVTTYYLTLRVNGKDDTHPVPVIYADGHYGVERDVLKRNHIRLPASDENVINVDQLGQVTVAYDAVNQRLNVTVPDTWLPNQTIGDGRSAFNHHSAQSSPGLLLNYDAYYAHPDNGNAALSTWLEQRMFNRYGVLTHSGIYRHYFFDNDAGSSQQGYRRYDTYGRYSDEQRIVSYQAGDFISDSLPWSHSVRMGGLRISRNFNIRPDIVTYPLLQYAGSAAVPTSVDLFINGYRSASRDINAGPYTLTNIPYINGAGEATIVTTDALGRQVSTTVPFYIANTLLRKGLSDFDLSVGALRRNYGLKDADYTGGAFSGIYRYGLTDYLTVSGHTELSRRLLLNGMGQDIKVGRWGTLTGAYSMSRLHSDPSYAAGNASDTPTGSQYLLGYSYYSDLFGLSLQHSQRSAGYRDLSTYDSDATLSRRSEQFIFSISPFGAGSGNLGVGYFDIQARDNNRTRLLNVSYSKSLWNKVNLYVSINKTLGDDGYQVSLQALIPFDSGGNASLSTMRDKNNRFSERVSFNKQAPIDGGLGWNLAYSSEHYRQAGMTWRTQHTVLQGGVYGARNTTNAWGEMSGSLIYMDQDMFAASRVNDAFIVVSTDGYADVPVYYENKYIGKTNTSGHILVPWVSSYYPVKLDIDTLDLPINVDIPYSEQRVSVREGSGRLVNFPVRKNLSAIVVLFDSRSVPLKPGTVVTHVNTGNSTVVGFAGKVYLENLQEHNDIAIQLDNGEQCRQQFNVKEMQDTIPVISPLICDTRPPSPQEAKHE